MKNEKELKALQKHKKELEDKLAVVNKQLDNFQIRHDHCFHIPILGREAWCNTVVAYKCNCGVVRYISAYSGFALGAARPDGYRI